MKSSSPNRKNQFRAEQISTMKSYAYAGWIYEDTAKALCLNPCPQLNSHEPPTLAALIGSDWKSGENVCLRLCIYPDLKVVKLIGELKVEATDVLVGCYDVVEELKPHPGKFVCLIVRTLPDDIITRLEKLR